RALASIPFPPLQVNCVSVPGCTQATGSTFLPPGTLSIGTHTLWAFADGVDCAIVSDHPHPCDLNDLLPAGVGMVDEGDEANNTRTVTIVVEPLPTLTPTPPPPGPPVILPGGSRAPRSPLIELLESLGRSVHGLLGMMAS